MGDRESELWQERERGKEREEGRKGGRERGREKGGCNYFAVDWQGLLSL